MYVVRRIHWLRACAQKHRWDEESILVEYEMQWTVQYFLDKICVWDEHRQNALVDKKHGAAAYVAQKSATWSEMVQNADRTFSVNKLLYHSPL